MGKIVIAVYRAKPGKQQQLHELMKTHLPILRAESLVTDRESIIMMCGEDTYIEVFEWKSESAIEAAHTNPAVLEMWGRFGEACDYVPLADLEEAKQIFTSFEPVNFDET